VALSRPPRCAERRRDCAKLPASRQASVLPFHSHLPLTDGSVVVALRGDDEPIIFACRQLNEDGKGMSIRMPQAHRPVAARRRQPHPVGMESDRVHPIAVPLKSCPQVAVGVVKAHRAVGDSGCQKFPVGTPSHIQDRLFHPAKGATRGRSRRSKSKCPDRSVRPSPPPVNCRWVGKRGERPFRDAPVCG